MLKTVLWVDANPFIGRLMEDISKKEGFKLYHLDQMNGPFAYLISDMSPELIVVEEKFLERNEVVFWNSVKEAKFEGKLVLVGQNRDGFNNFLKKPINPFEVIQVLKDLAR